VLSVVASATERKNHIDEVTHILGSIDFPKYRLIALGPVRHIAIVNELRDLGEKSDLSPEWNSENTYWKRAEAAVIQGYQDAFDANSGLKAAKDPSIRLALEGLSDSQLEEAASFFRSELFIRSVSHADKLLASLILVRFTALSVKKDEDSKTFTKTLDALGDLKEPVLSKLEEEQFKKASASPALNQLQSRGLGQLISTLTFANPVPLMFPSLPAESTKEVVKIIQAFRVSHRIPPPLPTAYTSDFISDRKKEKELREKANAAIRGDSVAFESLRADAGNNDPIAQAELGRLYAIGRNVSQDHKTAFEWTKKAADSGLPRAQYNLGVHYDQGIGVDKDLTKAEAYYRLAADKGFARAQFALGLMYRNGKGVPQDFQRSLKLIDSAANQGLPAAELAMAEIFDVGAGVWIDERKADSWLMRAQHNGYSPAVQYRENRSERKAQLRALIASSPGSARAAATSVDKPEQNLRLMRAVKEDSVEYADALLNAGAEVHYRDEKPYTDETLLHHAARTGSIKMARVLLEHGAKVNAPARQGFTPLHVASGLNKPAMVEFLIAAGADLNVQDSGEGMPLHAATVQGHPGIVKILLARGANPNATYRGGITPLHRISNIGTYYPTHTEVIRLLVLGGADLFARSEQNDGNRIAATSLHRSEDGAVAAVENSNRLAPPDDEVPPLAAVFSGMGFLRAVKSLELKGIALDAVAKDGVTALHRAASGNNIELVNYLIARGLQSDVPDASGRTPLHFASQSGRNDAIRVLVQHGAGLDSKDGRGQTPLMFAALQHGKEETIRALIDLGSKIVLRDDRGQSALDIVVQRFSSVNAARMLIDAGSSADAKNSEGKTALHYARFANVINLLIERGAAVEAKDNSGRTPIFYAVRNSSGRDAVKALIDAGAHTDVVATDGARLVHDAVLGGKTMLALVIDSGGGSATEATDDGTTPLHVAADQGASRETINYLIARGGNVNAQDTLGNTPLHRAVTRSRNSMTVSALIEVGADKSVRNSKREIAADIAVSDIDKKILDLLKP
jgi:ankyrin repeat protein